MAKIDALESDHRTAETAHAEIDDLGTRWLRAGHLPPPELERITTLLTMLQQLYARHIAIEDTEVFPLAQQSLDPQTIAQLGQEMAYRRGLQRADGSSSHPRRRIRHPQPLSLHP
jgi:hemerythrin-like domain-containing protein